MRSSGPGSVSKDLQDLRQGNQSATSRVNEIISATGSISARAASREEVAVESEAVAARLLAELVALELEYRRKRVHQHDVAHCDLKPSNILLDGDQPLITDFGLSRVLKAESEMDPTGQLRIEGTIPYMAPEQVRGDPGKASDIYALVVEAMRREGFSWTTGTHTHDPNVVLAIMLVTGYVIAVQTERSSALGEVNTPRN
jgi:serine/threonine protein kinase